MTKQISEQNNSNNLPYSEEISHLSRLPDLPRIRDYYDETWLDYRMLWLNTQDKAIHFGYWDERTRSHGQSLLNMNRVLASHIGIRKGQLVLAEARRLLRPGGRLGIVEYMRTNRPLAEIDEALLHSWLSGWAIPDIAISHEWLGWAQEVGFHDMQLADITSNVRPSLQRLYRLTILARPGASILYALGLRSRTQHGNMRGAFDGQDSQRACTTCE